MFFVKHKAVLTFNPPRFFFVFDDVNVLVCESCMYSDLSCICHDIIVTSSTFLLCNSSSHVLFHLSLSLYLFPSLLPLHLSLSSYSFTCSHPCITLCPLPTFSISCSFTSSSNPFVHLLYTSLSPFIHLY